MISFDKIVNKLLKRWLSVVSIDDISDIIYPKIIVLDSAKQANLYKIIYRLKANNHITQLKNWLYIIWVKDTFQIDDLYWKICHKIIHNETWSDYIISWMKSLEIIMKDYSLHNRLIVYTKDIGSLEVFVSNTEFLRIRTQSNNKIIFTYKRQKSDRLDKLEYEDNIVN